MHKLSIPVAAVALQVATAYAAPTICQPDRDSAVNQITSVAWESSTGVAKANLIVEGEVNGRVAMVREHAPYGVKTNLVFHVGGSVLQDVEIMVFPTSKSEFRVTGVSYRTVDGLRVLHSMLGNYRATCHTL